MTTHLSNIKEEIHDFVEGNLSRNEVDQLWARLIGSPDDLDYLQTLVMLKKMDGEGKFNHLYDSESKVVPLTDVNSSSRTSFYERFEPYLVAASVLIIGFAILFFLLTDVQQTEDTGPISMIEYEIERSVVNRTILDNHLQEAVSLAANGNLEAAFSQLDQASSPELTNKQYIDLMMVRGAIQYNSENYSDALQTFQKIRDIDGIDPLSLEKGIWYLANTQLQLGMVDEAKQNMRKVIELDGAFSRVARQKEERISKN